MKKFTFAILALLITTATYAQVATLKDLVGKVEVKIPGGAWEPAEEGMNIPIKSIISTGFNSTATFTIAASKLKVKALTRMTLEDYVQKEGKESTSLRLATGKIRAEVRSSEGKKVDFTVTSPVATASVRGTDFDFDGTRLDVSEGLVVVQNERGEEVAVEAGASTEVSYNAPPADPQDIEDSDVYVASNTTPELTIIPMSEDPEAIFEDPTPEITTDSFFTETGTVQITIE